MSLQCKDAGKKVVWIGILKVEADYLQWVRTGQVTLKTYQDKNGDLPDRLTSFVDNKKQPVGYRLEKFRKK